MSLRGATRTGRQLCSNVASTSSLKLPRANLATNMQSQRPIDMLIVGAGNINFGSAEGPWNHSKRLEAIIGSRLQVSGLIDPDAGRAQAVLANKASTFAAPAYSATSIYPNIASAVEKYRNLNSQPDLIVLGSPPNCRGTVDPREGKDAEVQLLSAFPKSALFVEKPVSTSSVEGVSKVAEYISQNTSNVVSVGYMLRYSAAVQHMQKIIKENNLNVMMTSARYVMAYEHSVKVAWWNKSIDGGPIVEQATHFCDLSRYFGGEVDLPSIQAHSIEWYQEPGKLTKIPFDENVIPEENRIPRFTSATWRYASGALGHLEHGVALHGTEFSTELTVFADGYQLKLSDPYNRPTLAIRRPGNDAEEILTFHDDDPFHGEMQAFIDTALTGASEIPILSSYEDAVKTYEMTWAIRKSSERSRVPP